MATNVETKWFHPLYRGIRSTHIGRPPTVAVECPVLHMHRHVCMHMRMHVLYTCMSMHVLYTCMDITIHRITRVVCGVGRCARRFVKTSMDAMGAGFLPCGSLFLSRESCLVTVVTEGPTTSEFWDRAFVSRQRATRGARTQQPQRQGQGQRTRAHDIRPGYKCGNGKRARTRQGKCSKFFPRCRAKARERVLSKD